MPGPLWLMPVSSREEQGWETRRPLGGGRSANVSLALDHGLKSDQHHIPVPQKLDGTTVQHSLADSRVECGW